ncbi:MAG: leucine-rich repeat domain-containing protein, partial [Candidatus Poribacteria bacterium]|nr:leucine-rich repeat domain-containing protein [Candidatus Poribacteria bacterium]
MVWALVSNGVWAEVVEIPDPNLRKALEQALKINADEDITKDVLAKLERLDVSGNLSGSDNVRYLTGLEYCRSLQFLSISSILIDARKLESVSKLTKLVSLSLGRSYISNLDWLNGADLPNLTKLSLSLNKIKDLSGLNGADLPNLTDLFLNNNLIEDLSGFNGVNLPKLQKIDFRDNPIN